MTQPGLFDAPVLPGLRQQDAFIDVAEHDDLLRRLDGLDLSPFRFQGWLGNRKTHTFGWRYDFETAGFAPAEPIPDWLEPLRHRAAAFADVERQDIVHLLVARYDPGAGIGWHRDRPVFDRVVGVSLGAPAVMRFRQRTASGFRRASADLPPRSAYLLDGEARHEWEHSIVPGDALRFSLTFRTLSAKGLAIADAHQRAS